MVSRKKIRDEISIFNFYCFHKPRLMYGGNYIKEGNDSAKNTCLIFSPKEEDSVGALSRYLKLFAVSSLIEARKSFVRDS